MLKYLKNNLTLPEVKVIKRKEKFTKKIIDTLQNRTTATSEPIRKYFIEYLEEINAILYKKVNITKNKNTEEHKLIEAFVMTDNALFYYYKNNTWTGPHKNPLFINKINDYKLKIIMICNSSHHYYLENDSLIDLKRFVNYNGARANLDYVPGIGFRIISNDMRLEYSIKEPFIINKHNFTEFDKKIIPEIFKQNKQIKYKPFYKMEHLKNNDIAIRVFILDNKDIVEVFRLYNYENHSESYIRVGNSFIKENNCRNAGFLKKIKSSYISKEIIENTNAKYFIDILKEYNKERLPEKIMVLLKYPFIEKLYKSGWIKYANILCDSALDGEYALDRKINELFYNASIFYNVPIRKLEISNLFKLNKYQAEKIKSYSNEDDAIDNIIFFLKNCLSEDFSSIDNNSFDKIFNWIIDFYNNLEINHPNEIKYLFHAIKNLNNVFTLEKSIKIIENFVNAIKNIKDYEMFFALYDDTISMLNEIELLRTYNIKVEDQFKLELLHTEVIDIYNSMKHKYENEKFIEKLEKIKYLEFEDENYKIVIPKNCEDLVNEGNTLHHCVASYIKKVINNMTNIVFIRKINEPTVPFFTVEISNYKTIEQIHGLRNCNIENEELKKFIEKWTKEKELTLNNINKIR